VVEFGPGIYGIGPAARFFFGREPSELTARSRQLYLATLLPAPVPRFAIFRAGYAVAETLARLRSVVRNMAAAGHITAAEAAAAQTETLTFRPARSPVPGASTMVVGPEVTDEMARRQVEALGVRPSATPEGATETGADDGDGPG
jgi:penicillin-binding protein 1A